MANSNALSTDNPKIIEFFSNHKSLDFEETILSFISIINKLEDQINNNLSNDNVQHILSEITTNNQNILSEINQVIIQAFIPLMNLIGNVFVSIALFGLLLVVNIKLSIIILFIL